MRFLYPTIVLLFIVLLFIFKASGSFFERQVHYSWEPILEAFANNNRNSLSGGDWQTLEQPINGLIKAAPVIAVEVFDANGLPVIQKGNYLKPGKSFLTGPSSLYIERNIPVNGKDQGKIRLKISFTNEIYLLEKFGLALFSIFVLFSLFLYLYTYRYNKKINKELLMLEQSIKRQEKVELLETREFDIKELALFQRKMKNDSKDMKFLKEELQKKENLALIGNFASSIVHDIRNPLSVINGYTDLLKLQGGDEKTARLTDKIFSSTTTIARLLEDILKFVREQKVELKLASHSPKRVIEEMLRFLEPVLSEKKVSVDTTVEIEEPIECDINRLSRALMNLVKNSIEVSQPGDQLTIKVFREDKEIVFSVKDMGPGIPDTIRDRVFEPFATAAKKKGTGLGLFIVKNIVEAHKGTLSFDTGPKGTQFFIKLLAP